MSLDVHDYNKLVAGIYNKMLANGEISPSLAQSTPASIRRECAIVYQERYEKKDEPFLRDFFGPVEHGRKFLAFIQEFDVNRFRPLNVYLKSGGKKGGSDRNLELLAWLINFQYRPQISFKDIQLTEEERLIIMESPRIINELESGDLKVEEEKLGINVEDVNNREGKEVVTEFGEKESKTEEKEPVNCPKPTTGETTRDKETPVVLGIGLKNNKWSVERKKAVIISLILVLFTGSIYTIWRVVWQQHDCMYWNGDQYIPVSCDEEMNDQVVIRMDEKKLKNFKRITRKDTITDRSIGRIYYIQDKKKIEYYTYSGNYPLDINRYVRKLTLLIFQKDSLNRKP